MLEDYVDVAERIAVFKAAYPEGSLQTDGWDVRDVGGRLFIVYRALAYRAPDDPRPGMGTAWEPFPGPTQFTRDSELMNAETAAWGRAIVAVGITASKRIASRQEIQARNGETDETDPGVAEEAFDAVEAAAGVSTGPQVPATGPQVSWLTKLVKDAREGGMKSAYLRALMDREGLEGVPLAQGWIQMLTKEQASMMIKALTVDRERDPAGE